jgi:hypothetical protein
MKTALFTFLLAMVATLSTAIQLREAQPAAPASIEPGLYLVDGTSAGRPYAGLIEVSRVDGSALLTLRWELASGETSEGWAIPDGDVVSLIFRMEDGHVGFGHSRRLPATWASLWSAPGMAAIFSETWTRTTLTPEQIRRLWTRPGAAA